MSGPYGGRRHRGSGKGNGPSERCVMSAECWQSIVGMSSSSIVGSSGSAIVGGGRASSWSGLPLPPPPPAPANSSHMSWGPQQPGFPPEYSDYPPKARPRQPSSAPPVELLDAVEPKEEPVDEVKAEDHELEPSWFITVSPEAPPLSGLDRPFYVQNVRDWLRTNFTMAELEALLS